MTLYNDNDSKICAWLRELIAQGHLPQGTVDDRSIWDIRPEDCAPTSHFFAGIGGWPYALKLASWPDNEPVWTGSCPCQPFSVAGKGKGTADERHLWPAFRSLIAECRPSTVFGEQVASKAGRLWLAGVRADLEALGYAVGASDLCAASVGAPHIRQRLYWVADASDCYWRTAGGGDKGAGRQERGPTGDGQTCGLGIPEQPRLERHAGDGDDGDQPGRFGEATARSAWATGEFILCADGKARRVEPGICPLAHGVSGRVVRLRGYGNAIVPQVAAEFVKAYMETITVKPWVEERA